MLDMQGKAKESHTPSSPNTKSGLSTSQAE